MTWRKLEKLGQGAAGEVFLVLYIADGKHPGQDKMYVNGRTYVMKIVKYSTKEQVISVDRELKALKAIKPVCNPYLMCIRGRNISKSDPKKMYIYIDYIKNSHELYKFLEAKFLSLKTGEKLHLMKQLIIALDSLHSSGVVHKDIKPDNILIVLPKMSTRLIDYGLSCTKNDDVCIRRSCGTPLYLSPEIVNGQMKGFNDAVKSDVWAMGISFIGICFGASLWDPVNFGQLMVLVGTATDESINKQLDNVVKIYLENFNDEEKFQQRDIKIMMDVIRPMLTVDSYKRPTSKQLFPILQKSIDQFKRFGVDSPRAKKKGGLKMSKVGAKTIDFHKLISTKNVKSLMPDKSLYGATRIRID